jgi:sugar lactone lactonase YvrE
MVARRLNIAVRCAVDARDTVGESPVWSAREQSLYWVDILAPAIHCWHPASGTQRLWKMPVSIGSIGLRASGGLIAALRTGFHLFDTSNGRITPLIHPEPDRPFNRFNDGKSAPDGSFWAGTMDERPEKEPIASLYRLGADHHCTRMVTGLKVSNGLAWSPDGRWLYHSDSRAGLIWRVSHEPGTGVLGEREEFVTMQPGWGRPDGAATDADGCYWNCGISAGRVNRFSPEGKLLSWIEVPVTHPTMPCFGGPELKTLYLTSLRGDLPAEQLAATPQAGGVFEIALDVPGTPVALYRG